MMTEKELIGKIRQLRQIRPRKDWVVLTKNRIFVEEKEKLSLIESLRVIFRYKYKLAGVLAIFVFIGVFVSAQNSLPGDFLFPLKKITEKTRAVFISESEEPNIDLELANKRLEEIYKIAQQNEVKKLAPAIEEYQRTVQKATKKISKIAATTSDPSTIKEIAKKTQTLEKNKEILEKTFGIAGLEAEEANPTKVLIEWLIKDLSQRTLTEEQELIFEEAKKDFENENYSEALIKIQNMLK